MRKISYWAKRNPAPAITLIVFIKIALIALALLLGTILRESGILMTSQVFYIAACILLLTVILYPRRKVEVTKNYYLRKTCDFMISFAAFISVAGMANHPEAAPGLGFTSGAGAFIIRPTAEQILKTLKENPDKKLSRAEKRILKREFNKQLLVFAKAKLKGDKDGGDKSAVIIITIIAALGLGFLLAALVCNLSCNGADAAAVIVGLVGGIGIVWGTIAVIRSINRKKDKNTAVPASE